MKRAEALYALGDTSKGHLHEEHASLYYGFGTQGKFLDRFKRGKKKPSDEITHETQSTAESVWQEEKLSLQEKLSTCERQLKSCKDNLETQRNLNNGLMKSQRQMADQIHKLEKGSRLNNKPKPDPKLKIMQEIDTNPNDTQSADSERLTLDELQAHRIHPNEWNR